VYPPIEPYRHGWLPVGEGHEIYWEECGTPTGIAVVVLHGGPGSGCTPNNRRCFDPTRYRVVLFDQRNCGRSRPHASLPSVDLSSTTTWNLVEDVERLRLHLGIEQWAIQGASWGATLAIAYAEAFPERVLALILPSATTSRRSEIDLLTVGLGKIFRSEWASLTGFAETDPGEGSVLDKIHRLLFHDDEAVRFEAARQWCAWEMAILPTATAPFPRFEDPDFRLAFARLVTHFWRHGCWLEEGQLLANTERIAHVPGIIIQGRLDLGNLSGTPWELAGRLPKLELVFAEDAGHEGGRSLSEILLVYTETYP
jgi:proline iminopeptidase